MTKPKILVVEDERVVAADIEESLQKLGYSVVGAAASGVSAIRRAVETEPDLVLMDIKLKGQMDGIDAAGEMHDRLGIPVVFLTAYADGEILGRAKKSSPSGYVLKPFDERALRSAVEIALDRHPRERKLAENERRLLSALRGFEDAVLLTESQGRVTFLNRAAERLTGWPAAKALGSLASDVLVLLDSRTGSLRPDPVGRALREGVSVGLGDEALLVSRHRAENRIEGTVTPLRDDDREVVGAAVVFHGGASAARGLAARSAGGRIEALGRLACGFAGALVELTQSIVESAEGGDTLDGEAGSLKSKARNAAQLAGRLQSIAQPRTPRPRTLPLNQVVKELGELLPHFAGQAVSVETVLRDGAGSVAADPSQLDQILLDFAMQASAQMPCGGKITVETDNVELLPEYARSHTCLAAGRYVVLSVSNAGPVMMPSGGGAKTDCPAAHEIVRDLGGDIVIRNEPGRLTTREIYLPRVEEPAA